MITWMSDELNKIGRAEELQIASLRRDSTLRNPVTIWVVRLGDDLYVRSVNGRTSAWFRGTQARHEGHIQAGGVDKDVTFVEESDHDINDQIDAAYRTKYRRYAASIIGHIVSPEARSATIKLVPRSDCRRSVTKAKPDRRSHIHIVSETGGHAGRRGRRPTPS